MWKKQDALSHKLPLPLPPTSQMPGRFFRPSLKSDLNGWCQSVQPGYHLHWLWGIRKTWISPSLKPNLNGWCQSVQAGFPCLVYSSGWEGMHGKGGITQWKRAFENNMK